MNKLRILSIGGVAFFTSLMGLLTTDAVFSVGIGWEKLFVGSIIIAGIQAGLAICQEVKVETETSIKACKKGMKRSMLFLM